MTNVDVPWGYLETDVNLSAQEAERIKTLWGQAMLNKSTPVLGHGIEFVPFSTAPQIPKAICLHCARPNLASSLWCEGCGAPLYG